MEEIVRLKSRFVSSRPGEDSTAAHTGPDDAAARLVEGILRRQSFYFQQRTGKLDMRAIGRVDVDRVVKDVDIDTLQAHLENITFANVSEDDLRLYSDQCFLNLFRLSQLLLEYLLNVQDTLATSLEALAVKHSSVRKSLDRGRAELHAASEQDSVLKREIRQKRATIARYEQLLALPVPPSERGAQRSREGSLHSCLTCGKMFTTDEFLQQHITRKHAQYARKTCNTNGGGEEKAAYPSQLRLFVQYMKQMSTGQCLDMIVQGGATVGQLRGYINSTAGFAAAGPSKRLFYRGVHLHDEQTLRECNIQTDSQLVLLHTEPTEEVAGQNPMKVQGADKENATPAAEEPAAAKHMSTLVELMRQQMEWYMRSESGRREQDLGSAEALEARMQGIEASLPRRLEEFMEESVGDLKTSIRQALEGMEELHAKRSNAGAIQDDEDETREKEEQEKIRLASLSADVERISKENSALLQELEKLKVAQAAAHSATTIPAEPPSEGPKIVAVIAAQHDSSHPQVPIPLPGDPAAPPRNTSMWELTFPSEGSRPTVVVRVSRKSTCETVCESIAAQLDITEARVVLRDKAKGAMVPLEALPDELQDLYERDMLQLEVLQGHVLSDHVVDGLVDFYEQNVPVKAKESFVVSRSMAEIDLAARRHSILGKTGQGGNGTLLGELADVGEDATDHAKKQVESIRAQLSATLTGRRFPANNTSISRTTPGLGLTANSTEARTSGGANGIGEDDIFGDAGEDSRTHLSIAELEKAVENRKRTRPAGIERQMESVSKSMEEQLNQLLEEAEEELLQLEEDSLGSETYSSIDPSEKAVNLALTDSPRSNGQARRSFPAVKEEDGRPRKEWGSMGGGGGRLLEDEDIPKSDWGRTLDTAVSIPEGAEERADQHEANAAREHARVHGVGDGDGAENSSVGMVLGNGGVDMTILDASREPWEGRQS